MIRRPPRSTRPDTLRPYTTLFRSRGGLHEVGSNNPEGVEIKKGPKGNRWSPSAPADGIPFHPYYTVKDLVFVGFFLLIAAFIILFAPAFGGWFLAPDNFVEANRLVTRSEERRAGNEGVIKYRYRGSPSH